MTIQMLATWNGMEEDGVFTLSGAEETRLIGLGLARAYTAGRMDGSGVNVLTGTTAPNGTPTLITTNSAGQTVATVVKQKTCGVGGMTPAARYAVSSGQSQIDFLSGWVVGTGVAGTISIGTGSGLNGNNSCTLNMNGSASYVLVKKTGLAWTFQNSDVFTLVVDNISGIANNDNIRLELSSDGFSVKSCLLTSTLKVAHGSKLYMSFVLSDATLNGGELTSNTFNYAAVRLTGAANSSCRVLGVLLNAQARPRLLIDFDDAFREQYTRVYRATSKRGLVGNIAVIKRAVGKNAGDIDTRDYCSLSQLKEMAAAGWDMMTHGYWNHDDVRFTSRDVLLADVIDNRDYVLSNFSRNAGYHYVYPGGIVSTANDSVGVLQQAGMLSSRLVDFNPQPTYPYGVDDMYRLWSRNISTTSGIATITTIVDLAIATGCSVRIHGHRVMTTVADPNNEITIADWDSLCDMLRDRVRDGLIDNETISQWYGGAV